MPSGKYGIDAPSRPSSSAVPAQDERTRRRRRRTGDDQTVLRAFDLTRRFAPQLPYPFVHEAQPVDVGLGQVPARGVDRERSARPLERSAFDERAALTPAAESEVLDRHEDLTGEVLVELRDVDVGRADAGARVEVLGHAGEARRRPQLTRAAQPVAAVAAVEPFGRTGRQDRG